MNYGFGFAVIMRGSKMLKRTTKKFTSLFLALIMCLSVLPYFSVVVFAADGVEMRLERLKSTYPEGMYWNHRVVSEDDKIENILKNLDESYADCVTSYPCTSHDYDTGKGSYDCNYYDEGYQCHGFAARIFYRIFGIRQSTLEPIDRKVYEIQPGDLVRLKNNKHSAIVLSVSGLKFTVVECNVAEAGEAPSCEIRWGRSYNMTDITYYVHASNYEKVRADTSWKSFQQKRDGGEEFFAAIANTKSNLVLTAEAASGNNVIARSYKGAANQIWKFTRLSNGSYKITSCLNGLALGVDGASAAKRVNVSAKAYSDSSGQKWGIYGTGTSLMLSADCSDSVLCLEGGIYKDGTSLQVAEKINHEAQLYKIVKMNPPSPSVITAKGGINSVSLSWTKPSGTTSFDIEIYNGGELYKSYRRVTVSSGTVTLPAGNYSVKIYSNNAFTSVEGNRVYFTVSDKAILGKPAKVTSAQSTDALKLSWTSVPGATGYRIYRKSGDSWNGVATVTSTSHTFYKLPSGAVYELAVRAYSQKDGKTVWAPTYTTFTAATKTKAPDKLVAEQSTTAIKISWSEVADADGYRIYYKTASGWVLHSSTAGNSKTFSGLPSGKSYTIAVMPYIKTSLGDITGEYRSIDTATKPAAPVLTLDNVKNLGADIIWNAVDKADGYQVFLKVGSTTYKLVNEFDRNKRGVAVSKLEFNKYYTFAIRAYVIAGGSKIYGPHTEVRFRATYL